jgi:WD40 repeat protein
MALLLQTTPAVAEPITAPASALKTAQPSHLDRYGDPLPEHAIARLGTVRLRHSDSINSLAFSPDGKILASAGDDQRIVLWDVATGKALRVLHHPNRVRAVLFTPDGKTLIAASNRLGDSRVHLWDIDSGKETRVLAMPKPNGLAHMVLGRDGKTLLTSTVHGPLASWDLSSGREIWHSEQSRDWCKCLALAPDGKTLATGSDRGKVCLREMRMGKILRSLPRPREGDAFQSILSLAFSPDGEALAFTGEPGDLECWNLRTEKYTQRIHAHVSILAPVAFAPDGKTLACGNYQTVGLYEPATGKEVARLKGHQSWIRSVAFSPDGRYLASAGQDQTIRIWNLATLMPLHPLACNPGGWCMVTFQPRRSRLVSTNYCGGSASDGSASTRREEPYTRQAWNSQSIEALRESPPEPCPCGQGWLSPDGRVFACSAGEGLVRLVDAKSGKAIRTVGKKGEAFKAEAVAFSHDGRVVAVVSNELGPVITRGFEALERLRLWDGSTGKLLATAIEGDGLNHLANVQFSPEGRLLAASESQWLGWGAGSRVRLWHLEKGNVLRQLSMPELLAEMTPVLSADGWLLVTETDLKPDQGQEDGKRRQVVCVREVLSGKVILCLQVQTDVSRYALSRDSRLLALGDEEGRIRLLEVASGKEVQQLRGHRGSIASLEFSQDGVFLASGSHDTTALVWDIRPFYPRCNVIQAERMSDALWEDLASNEVGKAFQAEQTLVANPEKATNLLKGRLRPILPLNAEAVQKLIGDLNSDEFRIRERATEKLRNLERTATPLLKKALKAAHSAEVRRRLTGLLADVEEPRRTPERLRSLRAVQCLKTLGTEPARQLLQSLAEGAADAMLTEEAREALESLPNGGGG